MKTLLKSLVPFQNEASRTVHISGLNPERVAASDLSVAQLLGLAARRRAQRALGFGRLAEELHWHGAPAELADEMLRAGARLRQHSQVLGQFATDRGSALDPCDAVDSAPLDLEALATEVSVMGCVRGSYGAFVCALQAQRARDHRVRRALRDIARDDAEHAVLVHRVHDWLIGRLDGAAQQRVAAAMEREICLLARECETPIAASAACSLGLPSAEEARAIVRWLVQSLWCDQIVCAA